MNPNEIVCLGVDGNIYFIKRYVEVEYNERGIPVGYEQPTIPSVPLIARFFSVKELEEHPLRKAYFKYLAAKQHNIVEKMRPKDVTIEEARDMVREWCRANNWAESQINLWIKQFWSF